MRGQRGFTLIELMMVVAIIGIMAAVAIPMYVNFLTRAKISEATMLVQPIKIGIADYFMTKNAFPANNAELGVAAPAAINGRYVSSVEVLADGVIKVTFGDKSLAGQTITLTPTSTDQPAQWSCATSLPSSLKPKGCS
jgi:type IV pilus assembly protein PilA